MPRKKEKTVVSRNPKRTARKSVIDNANSNSRSAKKKKQSHSQDNGKLNVENDNLNSNNHTNLDSLIRKRA